MESFSIALDCPGQEGLLGELWPRLEEYEYEVFEYSRGNVVTVAFEEPLPKISSDMLVILTMDFTTGGRCQVDIISGGCGESTYDHDWGYQKGVIRSVVQTFIDIGEAKGWKIREDKSQPVK